MHEQSSLRIAVIGGGAAGMMAAGTAAENGGHVVLFEKNRGLGKKLLITGKGRCNLCNQCEAREFLSHVVRNPRFLYSAIFTFPPEKTIQFFEENGCPCKTERGNRVFPVSDRSQDVLLALTRYLDKTGVILRHDAVRQIRTCADGFSLQTAQTEETFDRVILATGGASYPATGSTGDGYRFAQALGHRVTDRFPSLVPLETVEDDCAKMQGLSLKNTALTVEDTEHNKVVYRDFGEMLFTHFGVSGPMVLSASAHLDRRRISAFRLILDLKPALDEKKLDQRLLSDFAAGANRDFVNILPALLPAKMIPVFVQRVGIDPHTKVHDITKEQRKRIVFLLKNFSLHLRAFRPIKEAIVTAGGVDVKEIDPKTMQSRLVRGLYFAGEVIDVDAYTGGFNLQIAFSTGHLAGESAAEPAE